MAVGLVGALVIANVAPTDPHRPSVVTMGVLLALVPLGFVLLFEALVTWPEGGSYPVRRRATTVAAALGAALAAVSVGLLLPVLVHQAPVWAGVGDAWRAAATGGAVMVGMRATLIVWQRLWSRRSSRTGVVGQPGGGTGAT